MSAVEVAAAADDQIHPAGAEKVGRAAAAAERFGNGVVVLLWVKPFAVLVCVLDAGFDRHVAKDVAGRTVVVSLLVRRRRWRRMADASREGQERGAWQAGEQLAPARKVRCGVHI